MNDLSAYTNDWKKPISSVNDSTHAEETVIEPAAESEKKSSRKWLAIAAGVVAILILGGFYYSRVDSANRAAVALKSHQDSVAVFEKNAKDIKSQAKAIRKLSYLVFFDYQRNWRTAIFNNFAYSSENKRTGCRDFNDALSWREAFYESQGVFSWLNTWRDEMTSMMKACSLPPEERHRATLESLNDIYNKANETVNFCLNPKGNLQTFGNHYEELLQALDNSLSASDIYIDKMDSEAGDLYQKAISWEIDEYINNVLAK